MACVLAVIIGSCPCAAFGFCSWYSSFLLCLLPFSEMNSSFGVKLGSSNSSQFACLLIQVDYAHGDVHVLIFYIERRFTVNYLCNGMSLQGLNLRSNMLWMC